MLLPLIKNLFRPCLNWNLTYCLELLYLPTQGFILSPGQIQSHVVRSLWHLPAHLHLGRKYFCPFLSLFSVCSWLAEPKLPLGLASHICSQNKLISKPPSIGLAVGIEAWLAVSDDSLWNSSVTKHSGGCLIILQGVRNLEQQYGDRCREDYCASNFPAWWAYKT